MRGWRRTAKSAGDEMNKGVGVGVGVGVGGYVGLCWL